MNLHYDAVILYLQKLVQKMSVIPQPYQLYILLRCSNICPSDRQKWYFSFALKLVIFAHLKRPQTVCCNCVTFQERQSDSGSEEIGGGRGGVLWESEQVERRTLGQWDCSVWCSNDGCMSSYVCPNPQTVQHQEWPKMELWTLGDSDMSPWVRHL